MTVEILTGDCRAVLAGLPEKSVHCCVTSPPYFGLRDYGHDGQIGLEETPDAFVAQLVAVFREVRRVLRDDGTLWLNLGDSYANDTKWGGASGGKHVDALHGDTGIGRSKKSTGLKAKDLIGIPWRVAFALQADGWYLRQDIIWSKPNPMPESVGDRCTKSHEYIFLLSKSPRYFYDADAIAEAAAYSGLANQDESGFKAPQSFNGKHKDGFRSGGVRKQDSTNDSFVPGAAAHGGIHRAGSEREPATRNKRSVWTVATAPYLEAHFATFPPALIEPCILASTSEHGCCRTCGTGWIRCKDETGRGMIGWYPQCEHDGLATLPDYPEKPEQMETAAENNAALAAWSAACVPITSARRARCEVAAVLPTNRAVALDPFGGAGTTGLVADRLQRNAVLLELNPVYAEMARRRIHNDAPLFAEAAQ